MQLGNTVTLNFRGADCQLCFWGKQQPSQEQPYFGSLRIELGNLIVRLAPFEKLPQLYDSASFDWGGASSEHHLAASWKLNLQQHSAVYQQIAAKLGPNHPMAKLIQKELDKEIEEPASKRLMPFPLQPHTLGNGHHCLRDPRRQEEVVHQTIQEEAQGQE